MNDTHNSTHNTKNVVVLAICQGLFNSGQTLTFFTASLVAISMLGDNLTLVTAPITAMLVGTSAGTLPTAYLSRVWGRKWSFSFGALVGTIGSLVAAYAVGLDDFVLFNIGIFLFGFYGGAAQQYRFAVADVAPTHIRAKNVSIVIAMSVVGAFVGPETALLSKNWSSSVPFQGTFWVLAIFCALSSVIVLYVNIPNLTDEEVAEGGRPMSEIIKVPTFMVALIAALFGYVVMNFLMVVTPVTMESIKTVIFSHDNIKLVIQWHVVGMFLPGLFTGHLITKFGVVRIIATGAAILLSAVIVTLSGQTFVHFLAALVLLGIGWNFTFTGGTLLVTEVHTPAERAKVQGTNDFILFTGLAFSSLAAGTIYHFFGWLWISYSMLPVILTILLSALWLRSIRRKEQASETAAAE